MDSSTRAASILAQLTYRGARLWRSTNGRRRFHRSPGRRETSFCQRFFLRLRLSLVGAFDASGIGASSALGGLGSDTSGVVTSLASGTASSMAAVGREGMSSQGKIGASAVPSVFPSAISFVMAARSMPAQIDCGRFTSPRFCLISTTKGRCCLIVLSTDLGELRMSSRPIARVRPPAPTYSPTVFEDVDVFEATTPAAHRRPPGPRSRFPVLLSVRSPRRSYGPHSRLCCAHRAAAEDSQCNEDAGHPCPYPTFPEYIRRVQRFF